MKYDSNGLSDNDVLLSRKKNGTNSLTIDRKNSFTKLLIESLGDPIIKILIVVLGIKIVLLFKNFDWYETIGIMIAIFLASFISSISEYGSEKAFDKMQEEASKTRCKVKRNRTIVEIAVEDVVVGDIVLLEAGDKIPADGVIIDGEIAIDESMINGEAKEVYKRKYMPNRIDNSYVYKGTVVCQKKATMYVTKVGVDTMYGKLSLELSEETKDSPLKIRLKSLASTISKYGYMGAFLVSFSYLFSVIVLKGNYEILTNFKLLSGHLLYAITLAVTVIVVAVPEGLPMMITLVLSSNMKRMIKKNVLVRKLVGIETAGSLNILFTDKTGTLTKGKLSAIGYVNPNLEFFDSEEKLYNIKNYNIIKKSCVYSSAVLNEEGNLVGGNSTDKAIRSFITSSTGFFNVENEVEFNSTNKYSTITVDKINYIKGAPEVVLKNCNKYLDENGIEKFLISKNEINNFISREASKGIRVIALGYSRYHNDVDPTKNCIFLGLILLKDEIKENVKETVKELKEAGIKVVMVTGDNKETAVNIAKEVGILTNGIVLTSSELSRMNDEEVVSSLSNLEVLARSMPVDKSRLVHLAQKLDLVVGMTGDGVNDAPALKKADVGFAMGSGTEVSKEASDIIILDDNLKSIESAVMFGRTIFKSIRKFIIFQLTVNMCAVSLSIIGPFIGIESPITVVQMLWINMVMDTLAGLAFSFEPPLKEYMKEKPKKRNERIINRYMKNEILFTGAYSSLLCIIFLKSNFLNNVFNNNLNTIFTAFFGLFIFIAIFNSFNARTSRLNILADIFKNKIFLVVLLFIMIIQILMIYYGGNVFRTSGLSLYEFNIMIFLAGTVIPVDMLRKIYMKKCKFNGGV